MRLHSPLGRIAIIEHDYDVSLSHLAKLLFHIRNQFWGDTGGGFFCDRAKHYKHVRKLGTIDFKTIEDDFRLLFRRCNDSIGNRFVTFVCWNWLW